ncbi:MAG TPA: ABC transporter permease [Terracidiphilus sp.]|nr:ABC transporter permease [Terracidiphilus sp.]
MSGLRQNLKFAFRQLIKSPGFTVVAIVILALGIGANTAIFSMVNTVLLEPLPFPNPDRLVQIWHTPPQEQFPGMTQFAVSAANFLDWQRQGTSFEGMSLYGGGGYEWTTGSKSETIVAGRVTSDFFPVLGVQPMIGRGFTAEEDHPGKNHEVILTWKLWMQRFGGDRNVLGRTMDLDGTPYTIVGVMGAKVQKPGFAQAWVPMGLTPAEAVVRGEHHFMTVARLKPGVTVEQAQAEMDRISQRLAGMYPADDKGWGAKVITVRDDMVGDVRPALLMMLGAVGFVLLIACANVANLLFGRAYARRKEIAIRTALGASRSNVTQLLLIEAMIVSLVGGLVGLETAHFGIDLLVKTFADMLPQMGQIGLSVPVLLFTLGLSIVTGLLSGWLPALSLTRGDVNEGLKQGFGRMDADSGRGVTRSALVTVEVALSLVLLIGAGLMVRSLWKLQAADPGFDERSALTMNVNVPGKLFTAPAQETQFFTDVLDRVRALPGVESAAAIDNLPLQGGSNQPIMAEGRPVVPMAEQPEVSVRVVTPEYFKTMRMPVIEGRDIAASDSPEAPGVVVISKSMAKQFWPNEDAIGRRLTLSFFPDKVRVVVGVVGDVKQNGLDSAAGIATLYWPVAQVGDSSMAKWRPYGLSLAVRTTVPPLTVANSVTGAVAQANSNAAVDNVMTLEDFVGATLTQHRFNMELLTIFGALALLLCTIGIYSVLAYSVKRRMREIGVRLALGATLGDVARLVVMQGMKPTLAGVGIGLTAALAMGKVVSSLLYGVTATDAETFAAVTALMVVVSLAASLVPALRATRVDPLAVLRDE